MGSCKSCVHKVSAYSFAETGVRAESGNKKENLGVEQIGDHVGGCGPSRRA